MNFEIDMIQKKRKYTFGIKRFNRIDAFQILGRKFEWHVGIVVGWVAVNENLQKEFKKVALQSSQVRPVQWPAYEKNLDWIAPSVWRK